MESSVYGGMTFRKFHHVAGDIEQAESIEGAFVHRGDIVPTSKSLVGRYYGTAPEQFVAIWDRNVALGATTKGQTRAVVEHLWPASINAYADYLSEGYEVYDVAVVGDLKDSFVGLTSAPAPEPTVEVDAALAERFGGLVEQWEQETMFTSSAHEIVLSKAYQRIIALGPPVIPLVLEKLKTEPHGWMWALQALAQDDVAEGAGSVEEAAELWLDWGRARGYVLP
jgi:hypothetical protein